LAPIGLNNSWKFVTNWSFQFFFSFYTKRCLIQFPLCSLSRQVTLLKTSLQRLHASGSVLYCDCVTGHIVQGKMGYKVCTKVSYYVSFKGKAIPITELDRPRGFQEVEVPRFPDNRHTKVVRLSAYEPAAFTPRIYSWYSFLLEAELTPGP